jgi:hypothetical protein
VPVRSPRILTERSCVTGTLGTVKTDHQPDRKDRREIIALGMKGAALTAFGEIDGSFLGAVTAPAAGTFGDSSEGVKLGESTLSVFFAWPLPYQSVSATYSKDDCRIVLFQYYAIRSRSRGIVSVFVDTPSRAVSYSRLDTRLPHLTLVLVAALAVYPHITAQSVFRIVYHISTLLISCFTYSVRTQHFGPRTLVLIRRVLDCGRHAHHSETEGLWTGAGSMEALQALESQRFSCRLLISRFGGAHFRWRDAVDIFKRARAIV